MPSSRSGPKKQFPSKQIESQWHVRLEQITLSQERLGLPVVEMKGRGGAGIFWGSSKRMSSGTMPKVQVVVIDV